MRTRVSRTTFGSTELIEGFLVLGYDDEKLIIEKSLCPEQWLENALPYDEGTEEYLVDGLWLKYNEIESFVKHCDGG